MEARIFLENLEMGMKRNFLNFSSLIWELKLFNLSLEILISIERLNFFTRWKRNFWDAANKINK